MTPNDASQSLDSIVHQITTSNSAIALHHTLRNTIPKDAHDLILTSSLAGGQDPLMVLDMRDNTLGALYILAARLTNAASAPIPWPVIEDFCANFDPEQARLSPDRVSILARGIIKLTETLNNPKLAIEPLYNLVTRYPPSPSYLTIIHPIFLVQCVATRHFSAALPVLWNPITEIDTSLSDLHYNDNLIYHYTGGIAFAALKRWAEAEEFFEICVSSPGTVPSAIQLEALKKLKLVQLISKGRTSSLPKYTHPVLSRLIKNTPYNLFINAYPQNVDQLRAIFKKERQLLSTDKNAGLVSQAIDCAPRWTLKKLTATYLTLALGDIARAVGIESEDEVRELILSMIESNDISARISADGTVTFSDPPPQFTKEQVDRVLQDVQHQTAVLNALEMEVGRSKEFLTKAVRTREDFAWVPAEDDAYESAAGATWADEAIFS